MIVDNWVNNSDGPVTEDLSKEAEIFNLQSNDKRKSWNDGGMNILDICCAKTLKKD